MDIVKMFASIAQSVPPTTPTQLTLSATPLISLGGSSLAPSTNSIQVITAGYFLVTIELLVVGAGQHKLSLGRGSGFAGPVTETLEVSGTASGVSYGRTLIVKVSAGSFLNLTAVNGAGVNRDFTVSLCVARLAGA